MSRYDTIGRTYRTTRRPDPRIATQIIRALGDASNVLNVGAGAGSYEPTDRAVVAVEPSRRMIAQRPDDAAPIVVGRAEHLPFADHSFDAAMAVLTVHHWSDLDQGLRELRRVSAQQVILFFEVRANASFWLFADYFPVMFEHTYPGGRVEEFAKELRVERVEVVPVPADCTDGFGAAYWRRPEAYLDPVVRAGISSFQLLDPALVDAGIERLRRDLDSGAWHARYGHTLDDDEADFGYRLLIAR
ncbi:MAG TPA: class I SAM-dependent methyltransferase [Acidimicrobiia bacterium]|nr:class I SAM-dependent methyltransferase [Acidimicrobiia bacterium]